MVLFRFPAFFMRYLTESFRPFCIFVPMLEKNEIIQSALQNLKIESLNPMQEAALEQGTGRKRCYPVVTDRIGQDFGISFCLCCLP